MHQYKKQRVGLYLLLFALLWLSGCSTGFFFADRTTPEITLGQLADSLLIAPLQKSGASVSLCVSTINGETLIEHDAERLMVPASVQKLALAADALYFLPEDFRWRTPVYTTGEVDSNGVLHGDLQITGSWDPSLSGDKPYMDWPWRHLHSWADILSALGLKHIEGSLVAVSDIYLPGGWEVEDLPQRYAPAISQLTWNDGLITTWAGGFDSYEVWEVWPTRQWWQNDHKPDRLKYEVEVQSDNLKKVFYSPKGDDKDILWPGEDKTKRWCSPDPRLLTLDAFRQALRQFGITGGDSSEIILTSEPRHPSGIGFVHTSEKITPILTSMMKTSNNGWAEQIAMTVTAEVVGAPEKYPHWPVVLDSLRIETLGVKGVDACGMARKNNISTKTLNELLLKSYIRWDNRWLSLLPKANERNSTLYKRLESVEGRVIAKTGSLSRCRSLAGYVMSEEKPIAAFSIIVNNSPMSPQDNIDKFVESLVYILDNNYPAE